MNPASTIEAHHYQRWKGELNQGRWTWLAIVVTGIRQAVKHAKTRVLLLTTGTIVLGSCGVQYLLSLMETLVGTSEAQGLYEFVQVVLGVDISGVARLEEFREILRLSMFFLMIKVEMLWVLLIVSRVGPGLIAKDLKSRALPIYFAKPVTPLTYLAGKWAVVACFIAMVTVVPNLLSVLVGTLITGNWWSAGQAVSMGLNLVLSGAVMCVVGGAIVLALSSLTSDHRYVTVAWLAVCLLPMFAQAIVNEELPQQSTTGWLGCMSLRDNILVLTEWLFGMRQAMEASSLPAEAFSNALVRPVKTEYAALVLGAWVAAAIAVSYWRVVRFARSAANL